MVDMMHTKDNLHSRFNEISIRDPRNINQIAKEMGIAYATVRGFIYCTNKTYYKSLTIIQEWIIKEEQRLGIDNNGRVTNE